MKSGDTQFDTLVHKYIHSFMEKVNESAKKGEPVNFRAKLWCEFCGSLLPSWDVVMVERSEKALPIALAPDIKEQMACKTCIAMKGLKESKTENAMEFKASNHAIKEVLILLKQE